MKNVSNLAFYLVFPTDYMSIILSKTSNSHKSVKNTTSFIPVNRPKLCKFYREFFIAPVSCFVYLNVEWTVHRFYKITFLFNLHLREHIFSVKINVPANLPQLFLSNVRCVYKLVSPLKMFFFPVVLNFFPYNGSLRKPEGKSSSYIFIYDKQFKLSSNLSMVSLFSLFKHIHILFKLLFCPESNTVYPL